MSKQSETKNGLFLGLENFISSLVGVVVIILCSVHCGFRECVQIIKVITSRFRVTVFGNSHKTRIASTCLLLWTDTNIPSYDI